MSFNKNFLAGTSKLSIILTQILFFFCKWKEVYTFTYGIAKEMYISNI